MNSINKDLSAQDFSSSVHLLLPINSEPRAILSIPHSGMEIPSPFLPYLNSDRKILDQDLDYKVDQLVEIDKLRRQGVVVLISKIHRVAIELNRVEAEGLFYWKENTHGKKIVVTELSDLKLKEELLKKYHRTYFTLLTYFINLVAKRDPAKRVPFIDLHSMPSRPTSYHLKINPNQAQTRAPFCLSDLKGESCDRNYRDDLVSEFKNNGFNPAINDPYLGGYITKFTRNFFANAIQIEINRELYMDEMEKTLFEPVKIRQFKEKLTSILCNLFLKY